LTLASSNGEQLAERQVDKFLRLTLAIGVSPWDGAIAGHGTAPRGCG
jgi:hypothetical protein